MGMQVAGLCSYWVAGGRWGTRKPPIQVVRFATKEEAEEAKKLARSLGIDACVVAMRIKRKRLPQAEDFNLARAADWKLFP